MSTTMNVHAPHGTRMRLRAHTGDTMGAPLIIEAVGKDDYAYAEVTLFVNDHALAKRIAKAINGALEAWDSDDVDYVCELKEIKS